jgi:putative RecB family exonuclease
VAEAKDQTLPDPNPPGQTPPGQTPPGQTPPGQTPPGQMVLGQMVLGGMPRRLFSCTPSRLSTFDCPRRYRFTYLDRPTPPKGPPWAHNTVGAVAHLALHRWWDVPLRERTPAAAAGLVDRHWQTDGFRDPHQSERSRRMVRNWVGDYATSLDPALEPRGVERTVAMRTERLAASGRVDRIDERDGALVIVDYKTGRRTTTENDARSSLALALYAVGAQRTLRAPCTRVELHHLPSGEVSSWEHTPQSLERHVRRAEAIAEDIETALVAVASGASAEEVFVPVTGSQCSWCDFRRHCPQGQQAAPGKTSWAALADPD